MEVVPLNMMANSTINISTILVPDGTAPNACNQAANGTVLPLGVASDASRSRPDPDIATGNVLNIAALQYENIRVFGRGATAVPLYCNYAWSPGDLIMSDSNGYGIECTSGSYYVGRAEGPGTVGAYCPITVDPGLMH